MQASTEIIVTQHSVSEVVPSIAAGLLPEEQWLSAGLGRNYNTDSGERINAEKALTFSSVWQATNLISQTVAGLPLEIYERDEVTDDRERVRYHPAWSLLNVSPAPTPTITSFAFRETLQAHALLWGNGYAEIRRNGAGRPVEMIILEPGLTYPDPTGEDLSYWTSSDARDESRQIPARNVFHLKGLSSDGWQGYSVFTMAKNSFGLGLAQEKHGNRHFRNNARPNIALKTAAHLSEDQATSLRQRFEDRHRGLDSSTSTAVLSGGLEIVPFSISNEDSQWLQSRAFQRVEIASWFNIPPHMLGDNTTTAYASLVEENRRFLGQTLMPWLRKWAAESDLKLLTGDERSQKKVYFEHNLQSLIEADNVALVDQLTKLISAELITPNEARRKLNMNRRDDGKGDLFRNPAINPADVPVDDAEPMDEVEAFQDLASDRLRNEQRRDFAHITAAAKRRNRKGYFVSWVEDYYATKLPALTKALEPVSAVWAAVGRPLHAGSLAAAYCARHRKSVVAVLEDTPRDKLPKALSALFDELETFPNEIATQAWRAPDVEDK